MKNLWVRLLVFLMVSAGFFVHVVDVLFDCLGIIDSCFHLHLEDDCIRWRVSSFILSCLIFPCVIRRSTKEKELRSLMVGMAISVAVALLDLFVVSETIRWDGWVPLFMLSCRIVFLGGLALLRATKQAKRHQKNEPPDEGAAEFF